jgi:hypothetical protein
LDYSSTLIMIKIKTLLTCFSTKKSMRTTPILQQRNTHQLNKSQQVNNKNAELMVFDFELVTFRHLFNKS